MPRNRSSSQDRNAKAFLYGALHRVTQKDRIEDLHEKMNSPEGSIKLFARLTVYDLVMKENGSLSAALIDPPRFACEQIPGASSDFLSEAALLEMTIISFPPTSAALSKSVFLKTSLWRKVKTPLCLKYWSAPSRSKVS